MVQHRDPLSSSPTEHAREQREGLLQETSQHARVTKSKPLAKAVVLFCFVLASVLWGSLFFAVAHLLPYFNPVVLAWSRTAVPMLMLLPIHCVRLYRDEQYRRLYDELPKCRALCWYAVIAFFMDLVSGGLFPIAQLKVPSGLTALVLSPEPLVACGLSAWCFRHQESARLTWSKTLGLCLGVGGLCLLVLPACGRVDALYLSLAVLSAVGCGVGNVVGQYAHEAGVSRSLMLQLTFKYLFGVAMLMPVVIVVQVHTVALFGDAYPAPLSAYWAIPLEVWLILLVFCLLTLVSQFSYWVVVKEWGALAALTAFVIPIIGLSLGVLANDEWVGVSLRDRMFQVGGCIVVLCGTGLIVARAPDKEADETDEGVGREWSGGED